MGAPASIEELLAEARYHRQRYDLYRARMYSSRPTRMARLRELERAADGADARLHRARQRGGAPADRD
jgi:hypothetical protein